MIQKFFIFILMASIASPAMALNPIIHQHLSTRAVGMGNVRYTTGVYEDNFYANPARTTENPKNRFQLPKFTFEASSDTVIALKKYIDGKNSLSIMADSVGKPISARAQLLFPAYYRREFINGYWSLGVGMEVSAQSVGQISYTGTIDPTTIIGGGPAITIARRLLEEDRLSLGLTTHAEFRATSGSPFSMVDFLKGNLVSSLRGGSGLGLDFDFGSSLRPRWGLAGFDYEIAFAINNILGGTYDNFGGKISGWAERPISTPRTFNIGLSARKPSLWKFKSFLVALEFTDLGNNPYGSFYRTIHLGSEAVWKSIAIRSGINQGYFTGGLGFDFRWFAINLATYGEEMGLNAGSFEDRRFTIDFGFQI